MNKMSKHNSAKIIVHKFEEETNFKTLYIIIGDKDKDLTDIKFSVWHDGKAEVDKKEKDKSRLVCEFCEKVYTCIPRLLRHSKMHTVTNNYECNACDIAFSCYKTAEQHWLSCLWLKMYYQFTLPKLLLCNGCDRKFRNYDQLYNHRYKLGHFIPKTSDEKNCAYTPTLVYQCEVCGQWFNAISQLQVHRSQYHPQFDNGTTFNIDTSEVP
ncbi:testis-specific zinc finger protein topi-like isoform X2 [Pararge aegeria]|uniref:testis-specific zinc finger protein topi-like isoform X2 n=1 Tax=Pararge aegeria TaxID=116150 RepID=UPI0019D09E7E|nr:testis-specific zinc finger protein topi-like isoform X2 [Pararge aegeria]